MSKKILIIPDVHCTPEHDSERLVWAGKLAKEEKVDKVVCLGDFGELGSLAHFNRPGEQEGKRYQADVDSVRHGLSNFHGGLAGYRPDLVMLEGNHEARINTLLAESPRLRGKISTDDLCFRDFGFRVFPFKSIYTYAGIAFCHYFPSGNMGRPIGGPNAARQMLFRGMMSTVAGHSHLRSFAEESTWTGKRLFALSAGCYVHPDFVDDWNRQITRLWWYGLTILDGVSNGSAKDIRFIDMSVLKEKYS